MVSKRRLDCGLIGLRAPVIPKAPRSARKRGPHKKIVEDKTLCAFELLASLAGRLLEESISSASSNKAEEKSKLCIDQNGIETVEVSAESTFVPEVSGDCKGVAPGEIPSAVECRFINASADTLESLNCDVNFKDDERVQPEEDKNQIGDLCMANTPTVKDPNEEYVNNNNNNRNYNILLNNSEGSVQLPLYRDQVSNGLSFKHWKNVQLGIRDDDDNSFDKFSTRIKSFRSQARFGHRKIKKTSSSLRYRKAAPKTRDRELYSMNERMKSFYRYRNNMYTGDKYQYVPIKKRKLYYYNSVYGHMDRANVAFRPMKVHKKAADPQVKLKIKSFIVPELYVDVSETDTVGYLKRAVMDEITALLGGGIRVGVVLKGKKVRDDYRTLKQAGISDSSNLENVGFTLEPLLTTRVCPPKKIHTISPCEAYNESLRSPGTPVVDSVMSDVSVDPTLAKNFDDMNYEKPESSIQMLSNKEITDVADPDCKAIVPVLAINAEALTMVPPLNPKQQKRSEISQRRTRRPFSVTEVEALVSAVERLGTGRWRDVKMGAFENADHRTYVDLKDKWKTLVHTASISPQQRRGEPVPQELLDRVLTTHSYWSQHQSKQHGKINHDSMVKIENFS